MENILKRTKYFSLTLLVLCTLSEKAESSDIKDTLGSELVMSTLKTLHKVAEEADKPLMESYTVQLQSEAGFLDKFIEEENKDYKKVYSGFASNYLNISPEFGQLLYSFVRSTGATRIVEFGTSFGISTIYLASALRDNGGGELITTELEPTKASQAMKNLSSAGLSDLVDLRVGDALDTLKGIQGKIDLVHLDGAWSLYLPVLKMLEPNLRTGAFIIGENALDQKYLEYVRDTRNGYRSQRLQVGERSEQYEYERGNELTLVLK
jgi:predicted O-methyltransferase YrrM